MIVYLTKTIYLNKAVRNGNPDGHQYLFGAYTSPVLAKIDGEYHCRLCRSLNYEYETSTMEVPMEAKELWVLEMHRNPTERKSYEFYVFFDPDYRPAITLRQLAESSVECLRIENEILIDKEEADYMLVHSNLDEQIREKLWQYCTNDRAANRS